MVAGRTARPEAPHGRSPVSPAVVKPSADYLFTKFGRIESQLKALANQQNQNVVDENLVQRFYSGRQPTGEYNVTTYDDGGNPRATFGQLPDGNHGVAIYSELNDGTYVELNAPLVSPTSGTLTTTSTSFTTLAGSPILDIAVGASGKCDVTISAVIGISVTSGAPTAQAFMELYADGVATGLEVAASMTIAASAGIQITGSNDRLITGLSQGAHTLSLEYQSVNGQSVSFEEVIIKAVPY